MSIPSIEELRARNLPRLDWHEIISGELTPEEEYSLTIYFSHFVAPQKDAEGRLICVRCGSVIRGGIDGFLLGGAPGSCTMEWGIVHGECRCTVCRWPARAYHFDIGAKDNPIIKRLAVTLQYHPEEVSEHANA